MMKGIRIRGGIIIRVVSIATLALMWEVLAHVKGDPRLFPSFEHIIFVSLPSLGVFSKTSQPGFLEALGVLASHASITVGRILVALALGAPSGIIFGLTIHYIRGSGPISALALTIARSIPLLALIPLFTFWFGSSPAGIVIYIAFGIFVVISSDSYEAAANLSPVFVQQAKLLGGHRVFVFYTVYLPGIQMMLFGGLRNVIGLSWAFALGAEYVSATSGLGYIVYQSYLYTDMGKLAVLALLYMGFGYAIFEMTKKLFAALIPWRSKKEEETT